ncbi:polyprenyl glycosylphosphotransferase [Leucobacter sp. Psy1]|uniref:sugar transferase n=1 Tax=Leucobacter sp. Psy1 TaxID=2875729 RepID=UPI001CD62345|nr:sugar transferase [Leucobacter sp. Psy1]UBH07077.1 polyprenyl glycosylphosphotransferase [Leucobacter sp. Psy1]
MAHSTPAWERRYAWKLMISDSVIVVLSVFGAQYVRFGFMPTELEIPIFGRASLEVAYSLVSLSLAAAWLIALGIGDSRDPKIIGLGPVEYKRVINLTLMTFGVYAIIAFAVQARIGRGYLFLALPVGLFLLLLTRWMWRKRLHRQRRRHRNIYRTLIVGERVKSAHVAREISRNRYSGFGIIGAVTEHGANRNLLPGLPVVASYDRLLEAVDALKVNTLIMTSADAIDPVRMREIGWELESRKIDLIVTASLTDIAGPRIHMRPVSGLPFIHVEYPEFVGRKQFAKRMFDLLGATVLLALLSPVFAAVAIAVRMDSPGPVIFRQERVGLGTRRFSMLKFRSMAMDAEDQLPGLLDLPDGKNVLFKLKQDPRVTRVGRFLRRHSLDELPQLVNVVRGEMSLVGPRPPMPSEVDQYERWVHRRLLVKPGITGLWQVSGRSNLSWEDSVRLDLYYVENWSMVGDLLILLRTAKTVVKPVGAY